VRAVEARREVARLLAAQRPEDDRPVDERPDAEAPSDEELQTLPDDGGAS
jgi:hypothetical protein